MIGGGMKMGGGWGLNGMGAQYWGGEGGGRGAKIRGGVSKLGGGVHKGGGGSTKEGGSPN